MVCALAALLIVALPSAARAATFTVNSVSDGADPSPGDGTCAVPSIGPSVCTLRAAIQEAGTGANSGQRDDIIVPAGTYRLTLGGPGEDAGAGGDLDINDGDSIQGIDGAASTQVIQTVADRVFHVRAFSPANPGMSISGLRITGGQLGGIRTEPAQSGITTLTLSDSTVDGNDNPAPGPDAGGGGIEVLGASAAMELTVVRSTISGNEAGSGGGIYVGNNAQIAIQNSTISGNTATDEGGGIYVRFANGSTGTATITNSTIVGNLAPTGQGGGLSPPQTDAFTVEETILADNLGGNCRIAPTSLGYNVDDANTCGFNQGGDRPNTDPQLGPLLDNGGETQTHALPVGSPAVDVIPPGDCPPPATDQRGIDRPFGPACDIGAYELLNSRTLPSLPDCSPTGSFTLMMEPAGETPAAFHYKVDDGPTQTVPTNGSNSANISLPEGRFKLEYWSETVEGGQEPQANHLVGTALVDQTDPALAVASDQARDIYVITRTASVTIAANDPGAEPSGLAVNPTAQNEAVTTMSRGQKTATWTAVDLCENTTTQQFNYNVLGPGLGQRAVIEPLGPDVLVQLPEAAGARASQKGAEFEPVTQPREIPVGSTIDARAGEARITSSMSTTETDIQDGAFVAGIFQVLQGRNARRGLTTLELKGSNFRNCQVGEASAGPGAETSRLSRRARRRLRGDANGRFRTRGRHSAATVRGTEWEVVDRCDGTLTKVERGTVAVRDFRLRRTITLTGGRRYLARAEPPEPVIGKRVNVEPVKGRVFVKLPRRGRFASVSQKGTSFVPLTSARSIPVRSIVDTRRGTVALRTARNRRGRIQSGRFARGLFQVLQSRKRRAKGLTTLRLKGRAARFRRCGGRGKRSSAASAEAVADASLSRRAIRRLRARARGRYRTRGRRSAATVRGTVWNMTDSCAGTFTKVRRGKVAVRDFRRKRTIVLTAGKSYLARPF